MSSTVITGARSATRLIPTTVRVKVTATNSIHNTLKSTISMDGFYILTVIVSQGISVSYPQRTSWIQTFEQKTIFIKNNK